MFQLIVAVISIALVAALAIASIYYGGEAFTKSSLRAQVTTLVNGGQQIAGAVSLYRTDNGGVTPTYTALKSDTSYLASEPGHAPFTSGNWTIGTTNTTAEILLGSTVSNKAEICAEVARQATGSKTGALADGQFGCDVNTASATKFVFKL